MMAQGKDGGVALVIGAGAGLGAGLGRRFAAAGMDVALASRSLEHCRGGRHRRRRRAHAYACDATDEASVAELFAGSRASSASPTWSSTTPAASCGNRSWRSSPRR